MNQPPFFVDAIPVTLEAYVGDAWSYTLPEAIDPEESEVTITAQLGTAAMFMTFKTDTLSVAAGVTTESMVADYTVAVKVMDA